MNRQQPGPVSRDWQDGHTFHTERRALATGDEQERKLHKTAAQMAHVVYAPAHPNPEFRGSGGGQGRNYCIWVAGEQGEQAEGIALSSLDGIIDSTLEPGASVGWHQHTDTEETYYLLAGALSVEMEDETGRTWKFELAPGDSHRIAPGMRHTAQAGNDGARFIAIMMKCPPTRSKTAHAA